MKKTTRLTTSLVVGTPIHDYYYSKNERLRGVAVQEALEFYYLVKTGQVHVVPTSHTPQVISPEIASVAPAPVDPAAPAPVVAPAAIPIPPRVPAPAPAAPVAQVVALVAHEELIEIPDPTAPAASGGGPPEITRELFADFY